MKQRHLAATAGAVALSLCAPAVSGAATRDVSMGTPPAVSKQLQEKYGADANAFFPLTTTIRVGDTVRFLPVGFHNVNLPRKGGSAIPFLVANRPAAGEVDANGRPFWFNGQPTFSFNPALGPPGLFGKSTIYSGASGRNTGAPLSNKPKPVKIRFTKAGSFTYYCDIHPGMKGRVRVVRRNSAATTARRHKALVDRQIKAAINSAKALASEKAPSAGITIGPSGSNGVERYAFNPSKLNVKVGDTITFTVAAKSFEVHTATTGPGDAEKKGTYLGDLAATLDGDVFPGRVVYISDDPQFNAAPLNPLSHGNGFWNSGLLDHSSTTPFERAASVLFAAPGTYNFVCLLHPFMKATVTATA